jgi:hypothetical protein
VATSTLDLKVEGANKLRAMADALRKASREDLRKGLDRAIRKAARPTVEAVKEGARDIKTTGYPRPPSEKRRPFTAIVERKHTREKIAKAVSATVSTAGEDARVSFRVRDSLLPENLKGMPRKFDSGDKWRHPVMGNTEVWVSQSGKNWFFPPIKQHIKDFRDAIDAELENVRRKLEAS